MCTHIYIYIHITYTYILLIKYFPKLKTIAKLNIYKYKYICVHTQRCVVAYDMAMCQ